MGPFDRIDNKVWRTAAYVLMAIAGVIGLSVVSQWANDAQESAEQAKTAVATANRAIDAIAEESRQTEIDICQAANAEREVILQLVQQVTSTDVGADFTSVPGFENLDPEMQTFLRNLAELSTSNSETENTFLRIARELLIQRDCGEI